MATIEQFWLFHCGYMRVPRGIIVKGGGMEIVTLPFMAALAVHSELGPVLIDAPFGHEGPANAGEAVATLMRAFGLTFQPEWAVIPRIEQLGFRASDVNDILMTHLHWDHTGGMKSLAHANFHINHQELDYALGLPAIDAVKAGYAVGDFRALRPHVEDLDVEDHKLNESEGHDVFGDGTIYAIPLPGHSVGLVGYRLDVGDQKIFFLGDAAFSIGHVTRGEQLGVFPRTAAYSLPQTRATLVELKQYHLSNPDVQIITSHDFALGDICAAGPYQVA